LIVRILQALSALAIVSACVVFALCVVQWCGDSAVFESNQELSVAQQFIQIGANNPKNSNKTVSPLVEQADAFALYLNPPKPKDAPVQRTNTKQIVTAVRPVRSKAQFTLAATSYYSSSPEKSMALVSEPGSGYRWVKKGERLGHFVVESIERGAISYRNGNQLLEMAINTDIPAIKEQTGQTTLASNQNNTALFTTSDIRKQNTITHKTVQASIPTRVKMQPTVKRQAAVQANRTVLTSNQTSTFPQRSSNSKRPRTIKHKTTSRSNSAKRKTQQTVYDRRRNRT